MAKAPQDSVNLLPNQLIARLDKQRLRAIWLRVFAVSALLCILAFAYGTLQAANCQQGIASLEKQTEAPKFLLKENSRIRKALVRDRDEMAKRAKLSTRHSPLVLLSLLSEIKSELEGELQLHHFNQTALEGEQGSEGGQLSLTLATSNAANSAEIVKLLEDCGYFREVKLVGALEKIQSTQDDLQFSIHCIFSKERCNEKLRKIIQCGT